MKKRAPRGPTGRATAAGPAERAERVYGLSAALALFDRRPEAVLSIAYTESARRPLAEMLREAARRRIPYNEVDDDALARMAEAVHHEGVCVLFVPLPAATLSDVVARTKQRGLVLALDEVDNPHNVGAILRSAAYFGVSAMVVSAQTDKSPVTAAARRVAEGGAEWVPVARAARLDAALRELKGHGLRVIGADARADVRLSALRWPERAVLVLGHERHGLSTHVRKECDTLVRIPGSGAVDSLNVSVAAGVFIASYLAAHGLGREP